MLINSENHTCNPRNNMPGTIYFSSTYSNEDHVIDCSKVHLDYKDSDVSTFLLMDLFRHRSTNLLTGLRKFNLNKDSRIFIYVTSHGGDHFIKIRDRMVVLSDELNRTLFEMHLKQKYKEIVFFLDTCEAFTLFDSVTAPNIFFFGSSILDEKAKSFHYNDFLRAGTSDRGTYRLKKEIEEYDKLPNTNNVLVSDLMDNILKQQTFLDSTPKIRNDVKRPQKYQEFFGNKDAGVTFKNHILPLSILEQSQGNHFYKYKIV